MDNIVKTIHVKDWEFIGHIPSWVVTAGKRSMERVQNSSFECCNCMVSLNDMLLFVTAMKHQFVSSQKVKTCRTEVKVCSVELESIELSLDKSIVIPEYLLS